MNSVCETVSFQIKYSDTCRLRGPILMDELDFYFPPHFLLQLRDIQTELWKAPKSYQQQALGRVARYKGDLASLRRQLVSVGCAIQNSCYCMSLIMCYTRYNDL